MNGENPTGAESEERAKRPGLPRYGLLLLVTLLSVGVQGITESTEVSAIIITGLSGAMLLLALRAVDVVPWLLRIAAVLAVGILAMSILRATAGGIGEGLARLMNAAVVAFAPPAIAVGVIHDIRHSGKIRLEAVMGVLSLYMLLGMLFAFIYGGVDQFGSEPFFAGGQPATVSNCLYFSFTTMATVGYGDFVAASDVGHTLAVFEMMTGQIYLVTVVALIVGNLGRSTPRPRAARGD